MIKRIFFFLFTTTSTFNLYSQSYFNEVSDFQKFDHTYINVISGAGVSFVDFNQDGFDDIYCPGSLGTPDTELLKLLIDNKVIDTFKVNLQLVNSK